MTKGHIMQMCWTERTAYLATLRKDFAILGAINDV